MQHKIFARQGNNCTRRVNSSNSRMCQLKATDFQLTCLLFAGYSILQTYTGNSNKELNQFTLLVK